MANVVHPVDSDEEPLANTIGDVPLRWYDEYDHVGYDIWGNKIAKPKDSIRGANEIDQFLEKMEKGGQWRSVYNSLTGQRIYLTDEDVQLVRRIRRCDNPMPTAESEDPYAPWPDLYSSEVRIEPVIGAPPSKASFIPSLHERRIVGKYLHAIKMGWLKADPDPVLKPPRDRPPRAKYDLWAKSESVKRLRSNYLTAPKLPLPGHEESYNPAPEYRTDAEYPRCLRLVPAYDKFVQERFERLLDLYLCPRVVNMKARFDPAMLLPPLPSPKELWPYPCVQTRQYQYNQKLLGTLNEMAFDLSGAYFACAGSKSYSLWQTSTERMILSCPQPTEFLAWSPVMPLLVLAIGTSLRFCAVGNSKDIEVTKKLLESAEDDQETCCKWTVAEQCEQSVRPLYDVDTGSKCTQICWHLKGDYLASVHENYSILVHQLSKRRSHAPFSQRKRRNCQVTVSFHPTRPLFFIGSEMSVKCYDLSEGRLSRTLKVGGSVALASPIRLHPSGDHLIVGCRDGSVRWFDLELSSRPYKSLRALHKTTVWSVQIHPRLPLLATGSSDGRIVVTHGRVFADLLKEPLIVPVKVLQLPRIRNSARVPRIFTSFHPHNPWLLATSFAEDDEGEFVQIRLFTDSTK